MNATPVRDSFIAGVREVARLYPDRIAIEADGQPVLTYAELLRRVRAVAGAIESRGDAAGEVIALALDKSPAWVVGMLGVWWAGRAWMPLDPGQPPARRRAAAKRANCRLALVSGGPPEPGLDSVAIERAGTGPDDPVGALGPEAATTRPETLAYVVFTSGSSGAPKGVAVTHAGLVSMLEQQKRAFRLGPDSRSLWLLSTSFDASVSDVGTALLAGATLCLEEGACLRRPGGIDELLGLIERRGITYVDMPPAVLARLDPDRAPACLDTVVIGGEVCDPEVVRRWAKVVELINVYGPTEATVCTSMARCSPNWLRPLVGRPLAGVRYRVIDASGDEVADGGTGELWIGGHQLARGYIGDAPMTESRFVQRGGQRWYRTGDRVVRRGDDYEFAGRLDRQCKVRGMLVAPEEIEAALESHPAVTAAAVVRRIRGRRRVLVAFVEGRAAVADLREHLHARLPAWMRPSLIERVAALPRTGSGKLDLPSIERLPPSRRQPTGRAPCSPAERQVAGWFSDVLGVELLGVDDDFFALGGDSLAVVELLAAAASDDVELGPAAVAKNTTVAALARLVVEAGRSEELSEEMSASALRGEARELASVIGARWPEAAPWRTPWRHVLVTGATGFLGRHVVTELLRATSARLHCLVHPRGESPRDRLGRAYPAAALSRLHAVAGDVAAPRFGLSPDDWAALADSVDVVVHLAAQVNLAAPYRQLRAANLLGVASALEFAAAGRPKPLHYASTLSVFVSTDRNRGVAREDDNLDETQRVYGGYAQSKWAAEVLVDACRWPGATYRPGLLVGDRDTGRMPETHWLAMFIRGVAALGCVPGDIDPELAFDATPVDDAAKALVHLATTAEPVDRQVFHLAGERSVPVVDLLRVMRGVGIDLESVTVDEWRERLRRAGAAAAAAHLGLATPRIRVGRRHDHRAMDLCQATGIRFDCARARAAGAGICPVDGDWLARCVVAALGGQS